MIRVILEMSEEDYANLPFALGLATAAVMLDKRPENAALNERAKARLVALMTALSCARAAP